MPTLPPTAPHELSSKQQELKDATMIRRKTFKPPESDSYCRQGERNGNRNKSALALHAVLNLSAMLIVVSQFKAH